VIEDPPPLLIRARVDSDLTACVELVRRLRDNDGYPAFMPHDDFASFLTSSNTTSAFVAFVGDRLVGHVMTRTSSAPASTELITSRLALDPDRLGFVARLMVDPSARRRGIASALLAIAARALRDQGRVVVLDVLTKDLGAIALYEHEGWRSLGETSFTARDGTTFDEVVFVAPGQPELA
jgi:ribosomal protein S18 acetylase RimI-like enzyme